MLNNVLFWMFKEVVGRVNLGEGALDTTVYESKQIKVLAPQHISHRVLIGKKGYAAGILYQFTDHFALRQPLVPAESSHV